MKEQIQNAHEGFRQLPGSTRACIYLFMTGGIVFLSYMLSCKLGVNAWGDEINSQALNETMRQNYEATTCDFYGRLGGFFSGVASTAAIAVYEGVQQNRNRTIQRP